MFLFSVLHTLHDRSENIQNSETLNYKSRGNHVHSHLFCHLWIFYVTQVTQLHAAYTGLRPQIGLPVDCDCVQPSMPEKTFDELIPVKCVVLENKHLSQFYQMDLANCSVNCLNCFIFTNYCALWNKTSTVSDSQISQESPGCKHGCDVKMFGFSRAKHANLDRFPRRLTLGKSV